MPGPRSRWLEALEKCPDEWREWWGRRANELQDAGLDYVEAERQAMNEMTAERKKPPAPRDVSDVEVAPATEPGKVGSRQQGLFGVEVVVPAKAGRRR